MADRDPSIHHNATHAPDSSVADEAETSCNINSDLLVAIDIPRVPLETETISAPALGRTSLLPQAEGNLSRSQAARLRRIVRDGTEVSHRLTRMKHDLSRELMDAPIRKERGDARTSDMLADIDRAFDIAMFFADGQADAARQRLERNAEPVVLRRGEGLQASDQPQMNEATPRLWDLFVTDASGDQKSD
jgi:hypothetical protein